MEFRNLVNSGLRISEIAYGNWLTHGSQVERETAMACVRKALDVGIATFDTADAYAETRAESVLGEALAGERREGLEIFTTSGLPNSSKRDIGWRESCEFPLSPTNLSTTCSGASSRAR